MTSEFGRLMRKLQCDSTSLNTLETPSKVQARQRAAACSKGPSSTAASGAQPKGLSLSTVKFHNHGHIYTSILQVGAAVPSSTSRVCYTFSIHMGTQFNFTLRHLGQT